MEFDFGNNNEGEGLLKVNYSEKLITLVKDSRILGEYNFAIDARILAVVE